MKGCVSMKKILSLSLALLLLCACSFGNSVQVSTPSSLAALGYDLDFSVLPETMQQDVGVRSEEDMLIPNCDSFTSLDFMVYGALDTQAHTAMLLQAVPANTTQLQVNSELINVEEWKKCIIDVEEWKKYIVFKNTDIIVFDTFSLLSDNSLPLAEQLRQEQEANAAALGEKLDELLSDSVADSAEYRDISLALSTTSETRYLEYLWEYCHDHIGELIKKSN